MRRAFKIFTISILLIQFEASCQLTKIKNTLSTKHVYIPKTKVYLNLPEEFNYNEFVDYIKDSNKNTIRVNEIRSEFRKKIDNIPTATTNSSIEHIKLKINKYDGEYWTYPSTQDFEGNGRIDTTEYECILVFGDSNFYVEIIGTTRLKSMIPAIKNSILSAFYDESIEIKDTKKFKVLDIGNFKIYKGELYRSDFTITKGNPDSSLNINDSWMTIKQYLEPNKTDWFNENNIYPIAWKHKGKDIRINNAVYKCMEAYNGHIIFEYYNIDLSGELLFSRFILKENVFLYCFGICTKNLEYNLADFRKVTNSIIIKK